MDQAKLHSDRAVWPVVAAELEHRRLGLAPQPNAKITVSLTATILEMVIGLSPFLNLIEVLRAERTDSWSPG